MPDIVYLHGFQSGPGSAKARETRDWLAARGLAATFHAPQLPPHPADALREARALLETLPASTLLIGSSLGGFYATWLAETLDRRAVLINPSTRPFELFEARFGEHVHPYTGERFTLGPADADALRAHFIPRPDPRRYWLVQGSHDEVIDWRVAARDFAGCRHTVFAGDDHRLQRWHECLPELMAFAAGR
ncbi:hypothetical protein EV683_11323 [Crenobacter luteus]|uniref:YqiA/YcfP family alpha/beta fold hydrolase n=1 Tax=Crenobacter luteus TaxID=1452487 RepID=UPI00104E57A3|nr:YqiA/YcfP family alpha/beta fold hydrolase [Crenobacter luteus]TCP11366.1 hypothetical protein EV683_11323 [Crenobacter luteus]